MGKLEKIVVLTVLFLVAVVLGVALNGGAKDGKKGGPVKLAIQDAETPQTAVVEPKLDAQPAGLLNSGVELGSAAPAPAGGAAAAPTAPATAIPAAPESPGAPVLAGTPSPAPGEPASAVKSEPAPFLLTREGLEESRSAELMLYTWKAGDTFAALAERYYGSKDKAGRLKSTNEGRLEAQLQAGEKIWVPVADSSMVRAAQNAGGKLYVVKAGDVLGTISQTVYGSSKKWKKIFDANRDVLSDANALRVGMRLRIPE